MTDKQVEEICKAILDGFGMLADRIAGGTNPENVAMSVYKTNDGLHAIAASLSDVADAINCHLPDNDPEDSS